MQRDSKAFLDRFDRWKNGELVYENGLILPKYKDGKDDEPIDGGIPFRVTVTGRDRRPAWRRMYENPHLPANLSSYSGRRGLGSLNSWWNVHDRDLFAATHTPDGKPIEGLEIVSPEFDMLMLGAGLRSNSLTLQLWKERYLAKQMDKIFDEGLKGATKEMPVLNASDLYNPQHFRSTVKYNPKQLTVAKPKRDVKKATLKDEYDEPVEDWYFNEGLHTYPIEDSNTNAINLIKGVGTPFGDYNAAKMGINLVERAPFPVYTSFDLAPNPPEATYTGNISTNVIPINELSLHSQEILNPEVFSVLPKGLPRLKDKYTDETFVDRNGNVNVRNVLQAVKDFYKTHPNAKRYEDIYNSSGNLKKHINDVVKSAQSIPVPKGHTRQELVQAALFHDIGKVFTDSKSKHGADAVDILDDLGIETTEDVRNSIKHHMSDNMLDKDNLTRALHFADVARGLDWDMASFKFPHLSYDWIKPTLNIPKIPLRHELKTRINPWLKNKGYQTINLDLPEEEAWKELEDRVDQHLSFLRGVRDPIKEYVSSPNDIRNKENIIASVMKNFGLSREEAMSPEAAKLRMLISGTRVPMSPTGPGRRSHLFSDHYEGDGLTEYDRTHYSRMLGINPDTKDALYLSTSDDVLNNYASAQSDDRQGGAMVVKLKKRLRVPGESMSEYLLKNDFDMIDLDHISDGQYRGTGSMFEDPYRLLTGRSLVSDMKKEGIIKPKFVNNPDVYINEGDAINGYISPITDHYVSNRIDDLSYNTIVKQYYSINYALEDFGINFKLLPSKNGGIYMPKELLKLRDLLKVLSRVKENITPISQNEFSIRKYDNFTLNLIRHVLDKRLEDLDEMSIKTNVLNRIPKDLRESLLDYVDALEDPKYIEYALQGNKDKVPRYYYRESINNTDIDVLKRNGLITQKLANAVQNAFRYGGDASKYVDFKRVANKLLDSYLDSVKKRSGKKMKVDPTSMIPTPQQMIDFMKSKGIKPRYEIDGFGDNRVYVLDANVKNHTKNSGDIKRTYGYIVGNKDEELMDLVDFVDFKKKTRVHFGGKDNGLHSKRKISRKTLRTIGGIVAAGKSLDYYSNNKNE